MKGRKDEEKLMGPLFPRLHVNDTEKGGPRAPPRNKMALYEQLSVPSQRFSSKPSSMLPLPPNNGGSLVQSTSSGHGVGPEGNMLPHFHNSAPGQLVEKHHSHYPHGINQKVMMGNFERKSAEPTSYRTVIASGHFSTMKSNSFQLNNFSNFKDSSLKKNRKEDDFSVPGLTLQGLSQLSGNSQCGMDGGKFNCLSTKHSAQLESALAKQLSRMENIDPKLRKILRSQTEENAKVAHTNQSRDEQPASILSTRAKILSDASLNQMVEENFSVSRSHVHASSIRESRGISADGPGRSHDRNGLYHQNCTAQQNNMATREGKLVNSMGCVQNKSTLAIGSESCSQKQLKGDRRNSSEIQNNGGCHEIKESEPLRGDLDKQDDVSETSMVDSAAGLGISPDDVVEVIGQKQFWRARRAIVRAHGQLKEEWAVDMVGNVLGDFLVLKIGVWPSYICDESLARTKGSNFCYAMRVSRTSGVPSRFPSHEKQRGNEFPTIYKGKERQFDLPSPLLEPDFVVIPHYDISIVVVQQRVFAVQVFELHRLIKVQRLIAGSPDLLLEDNQNMSMLKASPVKKTLEYVVEAPSVMQKDEPQKPTASTECGTNNTVPKPPLPSLKNDTNKGLVTVHPNCGLSSSNASAASVATDVKLPSWCFHPPHGNQWLVPVMSPSEGLIYKPYSGSCPPSGGFMAPLHGGCGLTPLGGDMMNTAYGVPAAHQQGIGIFPGTPPLGQAYFPPYGLPVMNPSLSGSVEQTSPFVGLHSNKPVDQLSVGDIKPYQNSCNMSSQKSEAVSYCVGKKFHASKDSDMQGSTASSLERVQGDALPLFPMAPAVHVSEQMTQTHSVESPTRVIKVVPHNPRSATESAARIFQSIQEERKQFE
ncbi:hypothetical protein RJ641_019917 [Dillenia turbinata]|uniref:Uncharacterized protein n=1 Tax=Dillenia turbinata TaxID=194707 RepID=A0AAN8UG26_9MAGN